MATTTTSTNMSMPVPNVGIDPTPDWGEDLNSCLTILDGHDHTSGSGVQITPSAMNINSALTFANQKLTNAQYLGMYLQTADPADLGCLYYKGVDLYFNDGSSNHIRITSAGSVTGATGTITGLPSGTASASYQAGSGTFVFQSATNAAADIDGRSFVLRNSAASSKGLTLSPPAAMGSDYGLVLPAIPAGTIPMTLDASGNMGTIGYDAIGQAMTSVGSNAISAVRTRATGTSVAAGGVAISSSCASFNTASTSLVDVTNLSVTITTAGRPVMVFLTHDTINAACDFGITQSSGTQANGQAAILRGVTSIGVFAINILTATSGSINTFCPASAIQTVDAVAAGTYTYKVQLRVGNGTAAYIENARLIAYEL